MSYASECYNAVWQNSMPPIVAPVCTQARAEKKIISIQTGTQASKIIQSSARVQRMSEEVHKAANGMMFFNNL